MIKQRIISLAPSITETIFALHKQHLLVGVSDFCNYPDEAKTIDKIGGFIAPNLDRILSLKPNMVICTTLHKLDKLKPLLDKGIEIIQVTALKLFDAPSMIKEVGVAIGAEVNAKELANKIQSTFDEVLQLAKNQPTKRVCYLCTSNPFCNWKKKCQTNELLQDLGGEPSAYEKDNLAQSIVGSDPEVIIIPYSKDTEDYRIQAKFLEDNPVLKQTTAFKSGRIKQINGELLSRPGPRAAEGLRLLFELIHNE